MDHCNTTLSQFTNGTAIAVNSTANLLRGTDCDECLKKCSYPNCSYYPMSAIRYCRPQIFFLIENLDYLVDDIYPDDPQPSGYTKIDPSIRIQFKETVTISNVKLIYLDISTRLKRCGKDGETLIHEITKLHAFYYNDLSQAARDALNYISGFRRKLMGYRAWLKQKNQRSKIRVGVR